MPHAHDRAFQARYSFLVIPIAAALALSLSACNRDEDRLTDPVNPQLPDRSAQAPKDAGSAYDPDYKDPSIPQNPANKDPEKKDSSPPNGTGDPAVRQ
jgi:hypothetical protein